MKKLMIAMAAVAMVGAANAAASYEYDYQIYVSPYAEKDTSPGGDHSSWYNCYGMTQATAQELLGKTTAVSYSDVAKWLGQNFAENSAEVVDKSQAFGKFDSYDPSWEQYVFRDFDLDVMSDDCNDFISVALFNNGTDLAYEVVEYHGDARTDFYFDDSTPAGSSDWIAVPEPTSGLLMLLGMAGLALKRKRA